MTDKTASSFQIIRTTMNIIPTEPKAFIHDYETFHESLSKYIQSHSPEDFATAEQALARAEGHNPSPKATKRLAHLKALLMRAHEVGLTPVERGLSSTGSLSFDLEDAEAVGDAQKISDIKRMLKYFTDKYLAHAHLEYDLLDLSRGNRIGNTFFAAPHDFYLPNAEVIPFKREAGHED